jgi:hypothetical protein
MSSVMRCLDCVFVQPYRPDFVAREVEAGNPVAVEGEVARCKDLQGRAVCDVAVAVMVAVVNGGMEAWAIVQGPPLKGQEGWVVFTVVANAVTVHLMGSMVVRQVRNYRLAAERIRRFGEEIPRGLGTVMGQCCWDPMARSFWRPDLVTERVNMDEVGSPHSVLGAYMHRSNEATCLAVSMVAFTILLGVMLLGSKADVGATLGIVAVPGLAAFLCVKRARNAMKTVEIVGEILKRYQGEEGFQDWLRERAVRRVLTVGQIEEQLAVYARRGEAV